MLMWKKILTVVLSTAMIIGGGSFNVGKRVSAAVETSDIEETDSENSSVTDVYKQLGEDADVENSFSFTSAIKEGCAANAEFVDDAGNSIGKVSDNKNKSISAGKEGSVTVKFPDGFEYYDGNIYDVYIKITADNDIATGNWQCSQQKNSYLTLSPDKKEKNGFYYEIWLQDGNTRVTNVDMVAGSCYMAASEYARPFGDNNKIYTNIANFKKNATWNETLKAWSPNTGDYDQADKYILGHGKTSESSIKGGYGRKAGCTGGCEIVLGYLVKEITFRNASDEGVISGELSKTTQKVAEGKNIIPPTVTPKEGTHLAYWTCNEDMELAGELETSTIKAGDKIKPTLLDKIKADKKCIFTAHYENCELTVKVSEDGKSLVVHDSDNTEINYKVSINAADITYNGEKYPENSEVTLDGLDALKLIHGVNGVGKNAKVIYYVAGDEDTFPVTLTNSLNSGSTGEGEVPVNPGSYYAAITLLEKDGVKYTIYDKFSIKNESIDVVSSGYNGEYDGKSHSMELDIPDSIKEYKVLYGTKKDDTGNILYNMTEKPEFKDAGEYTVYYKITADDYEDVMGDEKVIISPKKVNIAWSDTEFTYDGMEHIPAAKVTNVVDGDEVNVVVSGIQKNAGTYTATASALDNVNYRLAKIPEVPLTMEFNINKADITVKADDITKHIGAQEPEYTYSVSKGKLVNDEKLEDIIVSRENKEETAGDYELTVSQKTGANLNYNITFEKGTFTIEEHHKVVEPAVDATCEAEGKTEKIYCDVCGEVIKESKETEALGHKWSSDWTIVKPATATETGKRKKVCETCHQKKFEIIPKQGTASEDGKLKKDAEVTSGAAILEATLNNTKKELTNAKGIFTDTEIKDMNSGADARVWLVISKTDMDNISQSDKNLVETKAKSIMGNDISRLEWFDADMFKSVTKEGTTVKNEIHEPGMYIEISVKLPESLVQKDNSVTRAYKIIRLHNNAVDCVAASYNDKSKELTFKTEKFSTFVIAYTDTVKNEDNSGTNVVNTVVPASPSDIATKEPVVSNIPVTEPTKEPVVSNIPVTEPTKEPVVSNIPVTEPTKEPLPIKTPTAEPTKEPVQTKTPIKEQAKPKTVISKERVCQELSCGLKVVQKKDKIKFSWGKVKEAQGYEVYAQYCTFDFSAKSLNQVNDGNVSQIIIKKVNGKKLNLKNNFKFYVVAYRYDNGKKTRLGKSIIIHIAGKKNPKETNAKKISIQKKNFTLSVGKNAKIKGKVVLEDKKKDSLTLNHASILRFVSSDKNIAKVSANGKIKAVKKGKCIIYVFAMNGLVKKVKVTVK